MQQIQVTLTLNEINQILDALGSKPYGEVYELITNLQTQAREQLDGSPSAEDQ